MFFTLGGMKAGEDELLLVWEWNYRLITYLSVFSPLRDTLFFLPISHLDYLSPSLPRP